MKRLYNVVFPIWLILLVPPIILFVLPANFIIDSIVLLLGFKLSKLTNWFDKYKKIIIKTWIIGLVVDVFGSLLLLITQFMGGNEFIYKNLVYPLVWNPFKSVLAVLYVLIVVIICGILIYIINYKISFRNADIDNKSKKMICTLIACITAPYLFFFPTSWLYESKTKGLADYQNSNVGDNSAIGNIISNLYSDDYMDSFSLDTDEVPYGVIINYKEAVYTDIYKNLEKDALIIFKLVNNINYVEFRINKNKYIFDETYVSNIYDNIKKVELENIYSRYNGEYFEKFTYLGHIDKYDVFDLSTTCGMDKNLIHSDSNYNYYIECSDIEAIYLINGNSKKKLKTVLEKSEINISDLLLTDLKITKEEINK